jgi:hypothetical protein
MFNEEYQGRLLRQLNIKLAPTRLLEARPFQAALPLPSSFSGSAVFKAQTWQHKQRK